MHKTVLFFGIYDRKYARTKVLQNGFIRNGWAVEECHVDPRTNRGVIKYFRLMLLGLNARKHKHDLVIVGFPGHTVVWLARLIFGPRVVFDAFLSLYDSNVYDRKLYEANTWRAKKDKLLDTWSCKLAGKVLLDTNAHIEYFVQTFNLSREKFIRVWISADDTVFFPMEVPEEEKFTVHFHGTFIPVQGVEYIVEAANLLRNENIQFRIIGSGQENQRIQEQIEKLNLGSVIERIGKVPVEQIPGYLAKAHVTLGLFGDREKTQRAIPNKVYEAMAMGKATITADTAAVHELRGTSEALSLVPAADPGALAGAIRKLKSDETSRQTLGRKARMLFEQELLPEKVVADLLVALG